MMFDVQGRAAAPMGAVAGETVRSEEMPDASAGVSKAEIIAGNRARTVKGAEKGAREGHGSTGFRQGS
jgi:hypothetical protein